MSAVLLVAAGARAHADQAANPIQHVIIVVQENRSFDSYFGTFPGANGFDPSVCVPIKPGDAKAGCVMPFHDPHDANAGGPHTSVAAQKDLDDGITTALNDGFVQTQDTAKSNAQCAGKHGARYCEGLAEGLARHDAMGYHDAAELANYWSYAKNFVLQDAMFAGVRSWSLPAHLELLSEWVATCRTPQRAESCKTTTAIPFHETVLPDFPWVSLFQLFDLHGVSWKYYLAQGDEPDCEDGEVECAPKTQGPDTPSIWNPGPNFAYVKALGAAYKTAHFQPTQQFATDIANGALPQVSWVVPDDAESEHPPSSISAGMVYVTSLVNLVMASPYWKNTAIFVTWDDWGGFYDHAVPPIADMNATKTPVQGYGIRVPGLMISAYARAGYVDHGVYSDDAYATFIENQFAGGARLDPAQLGNPDNRPDIRDALTSVTTLSGKSEKLGNLIDEFDFKQTPLKPVILSTAIPTAIYAACEVDHRFICKSRTVQISWDPVPAGGVTYYVQRDGATLPQCTGVNTSCSDQPGSGQHLYRAYTVDGSGAMSPLSAAAEADEP